jgi:hypothetical protein
MSASSIHHGQIVDVAELASLPNGSSVRLTGNLIAFDPVLAQARLQSLDGKSSAAIDTSLLESFVYELHTPFQFIGELRESPSGVCAIVF